MWGKVDVELVYSTQLFGLICDPDGDRADRAPLVSVAGDAGAPLWNEPTRHRCSTPEPPPELLAHRSLLTGENRGLQRTWSSGPSESARSDRPKTSEHRHGDGRCSPAVGAHLDGKQPQDGDFADLIRSTTIMVMNAAM